MHLYQCKEVRIRPIVKKFSAEYGTNLIMYPYFVTGETQKNGIGPTNASGVVLTDSSQFNFSYREDTDGNAYKFGSIPDLSTANGATGTYNDLYNALLRTGRTDTTLNPQLVQTWERGISVNEYWNRLAQNTYEDVNNRQQFIDASAKAPGVTSLTKADLDLPDQRQNATYYDGRR